VSKNMKTHALEEVVLTALAGQISDVLKFHRGDMQEQLEDADVDALGVRLPDGTKVAKIIATDPDPKPDVIDEDALIEWVAEHAPDEVVTRTVIVSEIRPAYRNTLLDQMTKRKAAEIVLPDGEIVDVPGVRMKAATRTHSVRFEGGDAGRALVAAAWNSGALTGLTGLAALTTGTTTDADTTGGEK
jgi:hypothetical protein